MRQPYSTLRVLILGEDNVARTRLRLMLNDLDIRDCVWTVSGETALSFLLNVHEPFPELIIADLRTDKLDRTDFCHIVRQSMTIRSTSVPTMVILLGDDASSNPTIEQIGDVTAISSPLNLTALRGWIDHHVYELAASKQALAMKG